MSLNDYFKSKTATEIMSESNLDRLFPNPGNEPYYKPITSLPYNLRSEKLEKLVKEVKTGDCVLVSDGNSTYREIYVLSLYIYFKDSPFPIKELVRINKNFEKEEVRSNYISEKCNAMTITQEENGVMKEVRRTLREELRIGTNDFTFLHLPNENKFEISNKTTYSFIKTKSIVINGIVTLPYSFSSVEPFSKIAGTGVFITPEFENGKFKRCTAWYLSTTDNMNDVIDKTGLDRIIEKSRALSEMREMLEPIPETPLKRALRSTPPSRSSDMRASLRNRFEMDQSEMMQAAELERILQDDSIFAGDLEDESFMDDMVSYGNDTLEHNIGDVSEIMPVYNTPERTLDYPLTTFKKWSPQVNNSPSYDSSNYDSTGRRIVPRYRNPEYDGRSPGLRERIPIVTEDDWF